MDELCSSIRTSIDDETLMALARKGIAAATPTIREVPPAVKLGRSIRADSLDRVAGAIKAPETPDSHHLRVHM